jgi:hypothetical protein
MDTLLGSVVNISKLMAEAMEQATGESWLTSPPARFELAVYNLFKVDYAAFGALPEPQRQTLMNFCEPAIAVCYQDSLSTDASQLKTAVEERMDRYSEASRGQKSMQKRVESLASRGSLYLCSSGMREQIEVNPPIVIGGAFEHTRIASLLVQCETQVEGLRFLAFCMDLFETVPDIFQLGHDEIVNRLDNFEIVAGE